MPFLPNFAEIKGYANTINFFSTDTSPTPPTAGPSQIKTDSPAAVVSRDDQPAPSRPQANGNPHASPAGAWRATMPPSENAESSSSDSLEAVTGRRKSSGASVGIADPEVEGHERLGQRGVDKEKRRERPRPVSMASEITRGGESTRSKKKLPLDVSTSTALSCGKRS